MAGVVYSPAMEPLPRATVDAIAALARLGLSEAEREALRRELAQVLGFVGQLAEVEAGEAGATVGPASTPLRPDEPAEGLSREAALANAARTVAGYFRVPPILE